MLSDRRKTAPRAYTRRGGCIIAFTNAAPLRATHLTWSTVQLDRIFLSLLPVCQTSTNVLGAATHVICQLDIPPLVLFSGTAVLLLVTKIPIQV